MLLACFFVQEKTQRQQQQQQQQRIDVTDVIDVIDVHACNSLTCVVVKSAGDLRSTAPAGIGPPIRV